jgi:hypothetical protein
MQTRSKVLERFQGLPLRRSNRLTSKSDRFSSASSKPLRTRKHSQTRSSRGEKRKVQRTLTERQQSSLGKEANLSPSLAGHSTVLKYIF